MHGEVLGSMVILGVVEGTTDAVRDGTEDKDGEFDVDGCLLGLDDTDDEIGSDVVGELLGAFDVEGLFDKICCDDG